VNALGNTTFSSVASTYLTVRYDDMTNNTMLTTHAMYIENFNAHNQLNFTYAIDILQSYSHADITVTLLNMEFKNKLAVLIRHINSLGQTTVKVTNCSFSKNVHNKPVPEHYPRQQNENGTSLYNYNNRNTYSFCYGCNDCIIDVVNNIHYDSVLIYSYFTNNNKHNRTNIIKFINCSFLNLSNSKIVSIFTNIPQWQCGIFGNFFDQLLIL